MKAKQNNNTVFIVVVCLIAVFFAGAAVFFATIVLPRSQEQDSLFTVRQGATARTVARDLQDAGLIRSELVWYLIARQRSSRIKAGTYRIPAGSNGWKILDIMETGRTEHVRITIPEGMTIGKTARFLESSGVVVAEDFIAAARNPEILSKWGIPSSTAEGYLFPDTYFLPFDNEAETLVNLMIGNFFRRIEQFEGVPSDRKELHNLVTLASIVEREYRIPAEAPKIAGVFSNRLRIGMGLQSCATIEYIITEIQSLPHPSRLTTSDLAIPSDYNTYLWAGLPPGPISNPGRIALEAAFNPDRTRYLYFRLVNAVTGEHYFSRTLEEHAQAGRDLTLKAAAR